MNSSAHSATDTGGSPERRRPTLGASTGSRRCSASRCGRSSTRNHGQLRGPLHRRRRHLLREPERKRFESRSRRGPRSVTGVRWRCQCDASWARRGLMASNAHWCASGSTCSEATPSGRTTPRCSGDAGVAESRVARRCSVSDAPQAAVVQEQQQDVRVRARAGHADATHQAPQCAVQWDSRQSASDVILASRARTPRAASGRCSAGMSERQVLQRTRREPTTLRRFLTRRDRGIRQHAADNTCSTRELWCRGGRSGAR